MVASKTPTPTTLAPVEDSNSILPLTGITTGHSIGLIRVSRTSDNKTNCFGIESELRQLGYAIHAISADKPENVADAAQEASFGYTLYSDASADAAKAFGLAFEVDAGTYKKLLGYGINIEAASGQTHHLLPVPAVFIIDRRGKIRFRHYDPDYKQRLSGDALLNAAKAARD